LVADLRYALRGLRKTPTFSAVSIVVLALGVAVNIAIFSLVNAVFFRPLPVKSPGELIYVYLTDPKQPNLSSGIDYDSFLALKNRAETFSDGAHRTSDTARLVIDGVERRMSGESVTGNYFDVLGVPALIGRTLLPSDENGDAAPAMTISESVWREHFHADPSVVGRVIQLVSDGRYSGFYNQAASSYTIVGVIAAPFAGVGSVWSPAGFWTPSIKRIQDFRNGDDPNDEREWAYTKQRFGTPIMRRRLGVSTEQAAAVANEVGSVRRRELNSRSTTVSFLASNSRRIVLPFDPGGRAAPERLAAAVLTISGLVLLIAFANLIGLFTARGVAQRGEVAIRLALGASRGSLVRYFTAQGLAIAAVSATLALGLGYWAITMFSSTAPTQLSRGNLSTQYIPADFHVPIDWRVVAFGAALPLFAGLVIAATRARQAWRTDVRSAMQSGTPTTVAVNRLRMRYAVVVPQVAAALAILMIAGMFIRALLASELAVPGFDATQVSLIDFDLPQPRRSDMKQANEERKTIDRKITEFAATIGGVSQVSLADNMTMGVLGTMKSWVLTQEQFTERSSMKWLGVVGATAGYFDTMGIRLLRGRGFDAHDERVNDVAVVSAKTAELLWPGQDPIGRRFTKTWPDSVTPPSWIEVIGVVNDVRPPGADSDWNPVYYSPSIAFSGTVIVRGPGRPDDIAREIVSAIKSVEPRARITRTRTLTSAIDEVRYPKRLATTVLVTTGLVGLILAAIGLYGVVSYSVVQRRREMGVRRALGAEGRDIVRLVLREGMAAAGLGAAAGLLLGYWAIRLANRFALPMPPINWLAIVAVPLLLALVVLAACLIPARRAARVDPIVVLRDL
jgi:putative ABC transport system permease protein